jgi:2,4-dienoyl-CoA reductase-like NADH-dependent reductase (Old Yellow Enzyme family)/thioredoxin reductase
MSMKLLEPIEINGMVLKNRVGFAPLLNMPDIRDKMVITDRTVEWLAARARGGAGFIMTGAVGPELVALPGIKEGFAKIAEAIHEHDCKVAVQISAGGPLGGIGPSAPPFPNEINHKPTVFQYFTGAIGFMPGVTEITAYTAEQLEELGDALALTAKTLKEAGVDAVELHCAHGGATLGCSSISPFYNHREDEYGGSWENRLRYSTGTIRKMRQAVGPDFPLIVRLSADELLGKEGITVEDTCKYTVPAMEKAGVDCFDISQGSIMHSPEGITIPLYYPRGCFIHHAEAVKGVTDKPVIGVGRIVDLDMAERFLQEDKADIIYLGRQLTSDADTPKKYFNGKADEIRKCIGCLEGCGTPCPINYDIFPDAKPLVPTETPKTILIVGGGVAGMEAARICALRGHKVTLMEKEPALGGTVAALALDPLAVEFANIVDYLGVQMRKLSVDVRVCKEVGPDDIDALKPDAIILATGASLKLPKNAEGLPGVIDHVAALKNRSEIGQKVVIWGLMYGAELAVSLAQEGKDVTLIGEAGEKTMASHAAMGRRWWITRKLVDVNAVRANAPAQRLSNAEVLCNIRVGDINTGSVTITDRQGREKVLSYDTMIISRGREKNDRLEEKVPEVHKIGDCAAAGNIQKAIFSANELARDI